MSTFQEAVERLVGSLTPSERRVLDLRFKTEPRTAEHQRLLFKKRVTLSAPWLPWAVEPRVKKGRGQRKNRRNRAARAAHHEQMSMDRIERVLDQRLVFRPVSAALAEHLKQTVMRVVR